MEFVLSEETAAQIVYAMEDQQHRFVVHRGSGELLPADGEEARSCPEGVAALPKWRPIDGFQLMERFVARLHNPIFRERLREALASGKGVFRKFKDILKEEREIERLWFAFKEREMLRVVQDWYNEQRELAGLERLELEPPEEEPEELLETDFAIVPAEPGHLDELRRLDRQGFREAFPEEDPRRVQKLYGGRRAGLPGPLEEQSLARVATAPDGRFAGFWWAVERRQELADRLDLNLVQLAVGRRFRGLGLGRLLLKNLAAEARDRGYVRLTVELEGQALCLHEVFAGLGFKPISERLALDPSLFDV
ncbi:MAG: GNAT family N-acetyltransferase [Spirochaetales bacterium]|nr:GNAT family N-acetyltransferase [Spirochaetales bacterium]